MRWHSCAASLESGNVEWIVGRTEARSCRRPVLLLQVLLQIVPVFSRMLAKGYCILIFSDSLYEKSRIYSQVGVHTQTLGRPNHILNHEETGEI